MTPTHKFRAERSTYDPSRIAIKDGDTMIGDFKTDRLNVGPFYPFMVKDSWFALYSPTKHMTRVMSLPDCMDLGGERGHFPDLFLPLDYYVPLLTLCAGESTRTDPKPILPNHDSETWATKVVKNGRVFLFWPNDRNAPNYNPETEKKYLKEMDIRHAEYEGWRNRHPFETRYAPFGFVGGMRSPDDTGGLKVALLDLRQADKGQIIRQNGRFGDIELAYRSDLKDSCTVTDYYTLLWADLEDDFEGALSKLWVQFAVAKTFTCDGKPQQNNE